jgi:hypothetical protein
MDDPADKPSALLLEGPDGTDMARCTLDQFDEDGKILLIKNLSNEEDRRFVALLRNPEASGAFLK